MWKVKRNRSVQFDFAHWCRHSAFQVRRISRRSRGTNATRFSFFFFFFFYHSTDGGNVSGVGFKVVLTAFRLGKKTKKKKKNDMSFLLQRTKLIRVIPMMKNFNVIRAIVSVVRCCATVKINVTLKILKITDFFLSSLGVQHCLDGSDENPLRSCRRNAFGLIDDDQRLETFRHDKRIRQHQQWRGILIVAFLLIILFAFAFFLLYLVCRRCFSLDETERTQRVQINGPTKSSRL